MLEAVTNPGNGGSGSGRGEVESSSSSSIADSAKGITEAPPTSSQEKGSKKAKKDKQEKSSSGKKLVQFLFTTPCDCFSSSRITLFLRGIKDWTRVNRWKSGLSFQWLSAC